MNGGDADADADASPKLSSPAYACTTCVAGVDVLALPSAFSLAFAVSSGNTSLEHMFDLLFTNCAHHFEIMCFTFIICNLGPF